MLLPTLRSILNGKEDNPSLETAIAGTTDPLLGIYTEAQFQEMLHLETRRSERSSRPFLLMRITPTEGLDERESLDLFKKIAFVLGKVTRDTDIKGWYKNEKSIGVIFTEIRQAPEHAIESRIHQKIHSNLLKLLNFNQASKVKIEFEAYPKVPNASPFKARQESKRANLSLVGENGEEGGLTETQHFAGETSHVQGSLGKTTAEGKIEHGFTKQRLLLLAGDMSLIFSSTVLGSWLRFGVPFETSALQWGTLMLAMFFYPCMLYIFDMYNVSRSFRCYDGIVRILSASILATLVCGLAFYIIPEASYAGRGLFLAQASILTLLLVSWRILFSSLWQGTRSRLRALVVGAGECGQAICRLLNSPLSPYEVRGILDDDPSNQGKKIECAMVLGPTEQIGTIMGQVWAKAAILATPRNGNKELIRQILDARLGGVEVLEMPGIYERLTGRVPVQYIQDEWLLYADGFYLLSKEYVQKIKRLLDLIFSSLILVLSAPLLALTAALIRLDSSGPVFYRQARVGKFGSIFSIVKFRSMFENAEAKGVKWASRRDPRVTRVGRWIRLLRIDEIPQLWNVFKGEMSLIGPRPERPEFVKELDKMIPYYSVRHCVTPGVTGWAQVNYPYGASVEDSLHKLEYDLYYIKNMSILLDLKIALKTVGVILLGDGAR